MPMICDLYGQSGAQVRRVARSYGKGATLLVIENVPVGQLSALRRKLPYGRNTPRNRAIEAPETESGIQAPRFRG